MEARKSTYTPAETETEQEAIRIHDDGSTTVKTVPAGTPVERLVTLH